MRMVCSTRIVASSLNRKADTLYTGGSGNRARRARSGDKRRATQKLARPWHSAARRGTARRRDYWRWGSGASELCRRACRNACGTVLHRSRFEQNGKSHARKPCRLSQGSGTLLFGCCFILVCLCCYYVSMPLLRSPRFLFSHGSGTSELCRDAGTWARPRTPVPCANSAGELQGRKIAHQKSAPQKSFVQWIVTGIVQWTVSGILKWICCFVCDFWCVIFCPESWRRVSPAGMAAGRRRLRCAGPRETPTPKTDHNTPMIIIQLHLQLFCLPQM